MHTKALHDPETKRSPASMERVPDGLDVCEGSHFERAGVHSFGFDPISLFSSCARVKATLANELCHRYSFEPDHRDSTVIPADTWFGLDRCHHELSRHCARCEHVLFQRRTRYFEETIHGKNFRKETLTGLALYIEKVR